MRQLIAATVALSFLLTASTAWAIQGYQDRHGIFYGAGIGVGPGNIHLGDDLESGLEQGGKPGLAPHVVVGGGATDNLLFGLEASNWIRTENVHGNRLNHQQWSFNGIANLFVVRGLYLEAGLGAGYAYSDAVTNQGDQRTIGEMGFSARAATGFEYFVNNSMAVGARMGYTRHFYSNVDFDTFVASVTLRWY